MPSDGTWGVPGGGGGVLVGLCKLPKSIPFKFFKFHCKMKGRHKLPFMKYEFFASHVEFNVIFAT